MERIFSASPKFIQDIAISLYGYVQYRARYETKLTSKSYNKYFSSENEIGVYDQDEALRRLLLHAIENVPFYRDAYRSTQFNLPLKSSNPHDILRALPIIDKKTVRENTEKFIADNVKIDDLIKLNTSGTTGTPATYFCSKEERSINFRFFAKILESYGLTPKSKSITFAGRGIGGANPSRISNRDYYTRTQYLSSYKISKQNIRSYVSSINSYRPEFIDSYPSALLSLVKLSSEANLSIRCKPKLVLLSSESVSPESIKIISRFFNAPVVDQYGSTEMAASFYNDGSYYKVDPAYCFLEYSKQNEVDFELISTNLFNYSMPLIRYATGDRVSLNDCNEIVEVNGRKDDVIFGSDGQAVGRLDPVFKGISNILKSQIVQTKRGAITVNIEAEDGFDEEMQLQLTKNIKRRLGLGMQIELNIVDEIPLTKNGKFRAVIGMSEAPE
jgi:phenylacetate-CoA ligase